MVVHITYNYKIVVLDKTKKIVCATNKKLVLDKKQNKKSAKNVFGQKKLGKCFGHKSGGRGTSVKNSRKNVFLIKKSEKNLNLSVWLMSQVGCVLFCFDKTQDQTGSSSSSSGLGGPRAGNNLRKRIFLRIALGRRRRISNKTKQLRKVLRRRRRHKNGRQQSTYVGRSFFLL